MGRKIRKIPFRQSASHSLVPPSRFSSSRERTDGATVLWGCPISPEPKDGSILVAFWSVGFGGCYQCYSRVVAVRLHFTESRALTPSSLSILRFCHVCLSGSWTPPQKPYVLTKSESMRLASVRAFASITVVHSRESALRLKFLCYEFHFNHHWKFTFFWLLFRRAVSYVFSFFFF